jgi:prepilin peptidase CpaA
MISTINAVQSASTLVLATGIALVDLRTHRIPNALVLPAVAIGTLENTLAFGPSGAMMAISGILAGIATLLPFYLAGGMGAGDVKAVGAIGAFLGPQATLRAVAFTLLFGGLIAVVILIRSRFRNTAGSKGDFQQQPGHRQAFAYGTAIAGGAIAALLTG